MIHALSLVAIGLIVCYVGLLAVLWRFQERVVFRPPSGIAMSEVSARLVGYRASDGIQLFAYIVGEHAADGTVLLAFHGNADLARWLVPWATLAARETNACVMLPEYRGYDQLIGEPTYEGTARDARAALDFVCDELGVSANNIVYFGHSLGTAIAAELAAQVTPRALVLQSPFSSAREMAKRMVVPGVAALWSVISRVHFNTIDLVRALNCPVWVAHGDRDLVIPVSMGRKVFSAAAHQGKLLVVPGAEHNDVPAVGKRAYWEWLRRAVAPSANFLMDPVVPEETPPAL